MPERTQPTLRTLQGIERALNSGNLESASRLSVTLHAQLGSLDPGCYPEVLNATRRLLETAKTEHLHLKAQLKSRRDTREGVSAYQQMKG